MPAPTWLMPAISLLLAAAAPAQPSVVGHYYLQGVMETGSELELTPDGKFQWYLVYGALDLFAQGDWRREGDTVILVSRPSKDVPDPGFDELRLRVRDGDLVPPDDKGAYVRARADAPVAFEGDEERPVPAVPD